MKKSQSTLISVMIILAITIGLISAAWSWGKPLLDKSSDRVRLNRLRDNLIELNKKIEYVSKTGDEIKFSMNLKDGKISILPRQNAIKVETPTKIALVSSYSYIPIKVDEMPIERENIRIETNQTNSTPIDTGGAQETNCGNWTKGTPIKVGEKKLNDVKYNVTCFNITPSKNYSYTCISEILSSIERKNCACEGENINVDGVSYNARIIDEGGNYTYLLGKKIKNVGLSGIDSQGVLIGRTRSMGKKNKVEFKIVYRGLKDPAKNIRKVNLSCRDCRGEGEVELYIEKRGSKEREDEIVNNVNIKVE